MRAARDVGPAARPLPLSYALSQAGRAVAAGRVQGSAWRLAGHGLAMDPQNDQRDLLRRVVCPKPEGKKTLAIDRRNSFAGVADATGSGRLTGPIELGSVWAAMPDLVAPAPLMPGLQPEWRRPLTAYPAPAENEPSGAVVMRRPLELLLAGLADLSIATHADVDALLADLEATYPTASGVAAPGWLRHATPSLVYQWAPTGDHLPTLCWPQILTPVKIEQLDAIAPNHRGLGTRMLLPRLAGRDFLSPLMMWWILLFGLSSVARYDPELWVAALDVNASPQAVPIEAALDIALDALPELIFEALVG